MFYKYFLDHNNNLHTGGNVRQQIASCKLYIYIAKAQPVVKTHINATTIKIGEKRLFSVLSNSRNNAMSSK